MNIPTYKLIIVGEAESGKSSIIARLLEEEYPPRSLTGVDLHNVVLAASNYQIKFNIWDCSGTFPITDRGYWKGAQCAMVVLDAIRPRYFATRATIQEIREVCGNIPILLVVNKYDRSRGRYHLKRPISDCIAMCSVSALYNRNIKTPFLMLAKKLLA